MFKNTKTNKVENLKKYNSLKGIKRPLKGLVVLLNEYYWKSISGPFLTFIFPVIFISILGWLMGYYMIMGGALTISVFAMSLTSMPQAIYEFKSSSLLKRIGATPIKPWTFILVTGMFYVFMMFVSLFWTILMCFLIFVPYVSHGAKIEISLGDSEFQLFTAPSLIQMFNGINWGGFIVSELLTTFIGVSCGLMIVSIAHNSMSIQVFGVIVMIISLLLSACLFPPYLLRRSDIMPLWWLGYVFSPFKSTVNMVIESWYYKTPIFLDDGNVLTNIFNVRNSNIFDCSKPFEATPMIFLPGIKFEATTICETWEKATNWVLPFAWIILCQSIALSKFKWTTR